MKKYTTLLISVLGALFIPILIIRPYEFNYNLDEEKGIKNIISKINDLAKSDSVYEIHLQTQNEKSDMDFLTVCTNNPNTNIQTQISFNRSGAFLKSTERKSSNSIGYAKNYFDVSKLTESLLWIKECKKLIPRSYKYRHTEEVSVSDGRISFVKIAVAPENENNIEINKNVRLETYKLERSSGGRRPRNRTIQHQYYTMTFLIDKNGNVIGVN